MHLVLSVKYASLLMRWSFRRVFP